MDERIDLEAAARTIAAWVRAEAENKDYAAACEWRNVADAIEAEGEDKWWSCGDCEGTNRRDEAFCWRCGAGQPDDMKPHPEQRANAVASPPQNQERGSS